MQFQKFVILSYKLNFVKMENFSNEGKKKVFNMFEKKAMERRSNIIVSKNAESISRNQLNKTKNIFIYKLSMMNMTELDLFQQLQQFAISILKKKKNERTQEEIGIIVKVTSNMQFFQRMNSKQINVTSKLHEKCCQHLTHEHLNKGQVVFYAKTEPEKFYIILKGSVSVLVLKPEHKIKEEKDFLQANHPSLLKAIKNDICNIENMNAALKSTQDVRKKAKLKYNFNKGGNFWLNLNYDSDDDSDDDSNASNDDNQSIVSESSDSYVKDNDRQKRNTIISNQVHNRRRRQTFESEDHIQHLLGGVLPQELESPSKFFDDGIFIYHNVATLDQGHIFGELGLIMKKPRSATILCREDSEFGVLNKEDYQNLLKIVTEKKILKDSNFLADNFFKFQMSLETRNKLAQYFSKKKVYIDQAVFSEGDKADEIYVIKKGRILLSKHLNEKTDIFPKKRSVKKEKLKIAELGEGEYFGEEDFFDDENLELKRKFQAECLTPITTLYVITQERLFKLFEKTECHGLKEIFMSRFQLKTKWRDAIQKNFIEQRMGASHQFFINSPKENLLAPSDSKSYVQNMLSHRNLDEITSKISSKHKFSMQLKQNSPANKIDLCHALSSKHVMTHPITKVNREVAEKNRLEAHFYKPTLKEVVTQPKQSPKKKYSKNMKKFKSLKESIEPFRSNTEMLRANTEDFLINNTSHLFSTRNFSKNTIFTENDPMRSGSIPNIFQVRKLTITTGGDFFVDTQSNILPSPFQKKISAGDVFSAPKAAYQLNTFLNSSKNQAQEKDETFFKVSQKSAGNFFQKNQSNVNIDKKQAGLFGVNTTGSNLTTKKFLHHTKNTTFMPNSFATIPNEYAFQVKNIVLPVLSMDNNRDNKDEEPSQISSSKNANITYQDLKKLVSKIKTSK